MGLWLIFPRTLETTLVFLLEGTEVYLFSGKDFLWMGVPFANLNLVLAQELLRKGLVITLTFSWGLSLSPFFTIKKFVGSSAPSTTTALSLLTWRALLKGHLGCRWSFWLSLSTVLFPSLHYASWSWLQYVSQLDFGGPCLISNSSHPVCLQSP